MRAMRALTARTRHRRAVRQNGTIALIALYLSLYPLLHPISTHLHDSRPSAYYLNSILHAPERFLSILEAYSPALAFPIRTRTHACLLIIARIQYVSRPHVLFGWTYPPLGLWTP
ncbi:hypothetical protein C8Q74DRAFT_1295287 [Fomes fomentarius]|nr:hypothetical protein C8Q74DRAFT_1295287 [Fomes fomentarius]